MGQERWDELFERARECSMHRGQWAEADRLWREVIAAYRPAARADRDARRQLARALWRHSMLLMMLGRAGEGRPAAQEAIEVFGRVHEAVRAEHTDPVAPAPDEALAELVTAVVDAGEVAFAAGDAAARLELLERALAVASENAGPPPAAGPRTRRAMGTAFHNQATALLHGLVPGAVAMPAALAASRAAEIRQHLLDPTDPLTLWELVNTYTVYARCLAMAGELDQARLVVQVAEQGIDVLGPGAADLRPKLQAAADAVRRGRARWWRR